MKCCKTCVHAKWTLTKNGRINPHAPGECTVPVEMPIMPACMLPPTLYRTCIWTDKILDCELWQAKEHMKVTER